MNDEAHRIDIDALQRYCRGLYERLIMPDIDGSYWIALFNEYLPEAFARGLEPFSVVRWNVPECFAIRVWREMV